MGFTTGELDRLYRQEEEGPSKTEAGVLAGMRAMRLDEAAPRGLDQPHTLDPGCVDGDWQHVHHVSASGPGYEDDEEGKHDRQSARPEQWPRERDGERPLNQTVWVREPSTRKNGRSAHTQRWGDESRNDEEDLFLVPVTRSPAKTPHRHSRRPITPRGALEQGGILADSAKEVQYARRRSLAGADHLHGAAVGDHVADEVEERTRRSHNDRYVWRPDDSFANSSPLPDPGRSVHDLPQTPNRRYDARPSPVLRHSGALSYERQVQRPPSAHRPRDNLETSAVIARAPRHRPSLRMFHEADHLEASGFRPRDPEFERVDRPTSRGTPAPADTWSLSPSSRKSSSLASMSTPASSPARSRILSFGGAHVYADGTDDGQPPSPSPASPSHATARASRRPTDALQFSGAVVSPTAPTTPEDADVEAFHRHVHAQRRRGGGGTLDTCNGDEDVEDDEEGRRGQGPPAARDAQRDQRMTPRQQRQQPYATPPPQRARSANRPRDNLAFSGGVTRRTSRLFDLLPQ